MRNSSRAQCNGGRLPSFLFNFSTEFIDVEKALNYTNHQHRLFIIYTDSQSVLETLQSNTYPPTFSFMINIYKDLSDGSFDIKFSWIPSHVGMRENEIPDAAAKQAHIYINCPIPYHDIKILIKILATAD